MRRSLAVAAFLLSAAASPVFADISHRDDVRSFIDEMVAKHDFKREQLAALFARTHFREDIVRAISKPAEAKPWAKYRTFFLTEDRIEQGAEFWREHARSLARAEQRYGVPAQIIVAIIGVETRYGAFTGTYKVMDALSTLAFDYPPRAAYFRSELEQFLLMTREEHIEPMSVSGSYAGAMGEPQFMPSSFRKFAVDFDQDGRRDLWHNVDDVVGSVANYFSVHGWTAGGPVTTAARIGPDTDPALLTDAGLELKRTVGNLAAAGVRPEQRLPGETDAKLLVLDGESGPEYWLALHNFYVITRYNHSPLYAMAVYQLSERIRSRYHGRTN